jgi:hypothetical protein
MLTNLLAGAMLLTLCTGSAMAEGAQTEERTQITPAPIVIHSSDEIHRALPTENLARPEAAIGVPASQRPVWKQEPESVSRGTEP